MKITHSCAPAEVKKDSIVLECDADASVSSWDFCRGRQMRRRDFIFVIGAAGVRPRAARAATDAGDSAFLLGAKQGATVPDGADSFVIPQRNSKRGASS
jgi:hypothetical protein